ncbi:MAG: hypothetical protein M5T52_24305 [Ignavibacteriaceae bacterium]|nr:hypothetical protein [Ignavibacteriaceae bacterium]
MNSQFPIVKIDRTTITELLPVFINKGIFAKYDGLPERADLLDQLKINLGVAELTTEQEREFLSQVGEYKTDDFVVRDYGNYLIKFTLNTYKGNLEDDLPRVRLNKLGHRVAMVILSEVYHQRKWTDLEISKERILEYLGYTSADKYIYADINDIMFSLRWLEYEIIEFKNNISVKKKNIKTGNFIYNLDWNSKSYVLDINKKFVGSIVYVLSDGKSDLPGNAFKRGYFNYPTALLPLSSNYSQGAYLLTHFLMVERGNSKLNTSIHKVIAQKISTLMEIMKLNYSRDDRNTQAFLNALEETQIIDRVDPDLSTLRELKTSRIQDQVVHLYVKKDIKLLDSEIKSNLLVTKMEKK